jgi:adenine/guanine phosphoribosyltransferase-like PRPP-binding protein
MLAGHNVVPLTVGRSTAADRIARPIEYDGVFLGAAVAHELGVRFIAGNARVTEMDQSIWPNLEYAARSARQLFRAARVRS